MVCVLVGAGLVVCNVCVGGVMFHIVEILYCVNLSVLFASANLMLVSHMSDSQGANMEKVGNWSGTIFSISVALLLWLSLAGTLVFLWEKVLLG